TTYILQPSEIPFEKLKLKYDKAFDNFRFTNNQRIVTKYSFAQVFGEAFFKTYTPAAIRNTYTATGIWPWNPNAINPNRLAPSLSTEKKLEVSFKLQHEHDTRNHKIAQLEKEN